ncbi:MAG: TRAP transporter substrate-binding protein [Paracoccaceae bacterium]|nr:TRAP transporter substrate-binding protein [Paracoccaceae bacterium]MDP7186761.1 TRAP transporter substrate-binding protein [Paracoccaceae bacterium]
MTTRRTMIGLLGGAAMAAISAGGAFAQEVNLKMHGFLPLGATIPAQIIQPWIDQVEENSNGSIQIEHFGAMALGGTPPELFDQVVDGVTDIAWTVIGYTPGRFPSTEVMELPFMVSDARSASSALWQITEGQLMDTEFKDVKVLGTWVHGPGMFHTADPVEVPSDLEGMKIRGGSRMVNQLLEATGATPVGMPVPAVPEALSKGVIDGTTIPWEVTGTLKVPELVTNHTEFDGPALYVLTFVMAMNKDTWNSLSAEQQAAVEAASGLQFSIFAGGTQEDADAPARAVAVELGNNIITVSEEDAAKWAEVVNPIIDGWKVDMETRGIDGQALIDQANDLMAAYGN